MELSIDPFQKTLLRIFCQSVDSKIEYKSIEFCNKTTVQEVIILLIKILRLENQVSDFVLCETIGRCMALSERGSIKRKIAKAGKPSLFIEQNRRLLMNSDIILTILTYWKPSRNFSRRLELCYANTKNQMSSLPISDEEIDIRSAQNGSLSSILDVLLREVDNKSTQTDLLMNKSISENKRAKCPHLLTLKGDGNNLIILLNGCTEFGGPGSNAKVCLKRLSNCKNEIICTILNEQSKSKSGTRILFENKFNSEDILITINGIIVADRQVLAPGDIINIDEFYSFFFKDSYFDPDKVSIKDYVNTKEGGATKSITGHSDNSQISNSVSSASDSTRVKEIRSLKQSKITIANLNLMTLNVFDIALAQLIRHYLNDKMKLHYAVGLTLHLIRYCRESATSCFTIDSMHDNITQRFCKTLEEAYHQDNYQVASFKLTALGFQIWMVYHSDNCINSTEEGKQWMDYFELFTQETFTSLSTFICERANNMSLCFFHENPFVNIDQSSNDLDEDNEHTMDKLLNLLMEVYQKINRICCSQTIEIFKRVLTSRIVISLTESIVTVILSELKSFTWNKGIFISSQIDKFEKWLKDEGQMSVYEDDGFLHDFSKLVSTRESVLKGMNWRQLRLSYKRIPASILRQFLTSMISKSDINFVKWQPNQDEMYESNKDVGEVLSEYLRLVDNFTLFQPAIILQNESIDISEITRTSDFISICTVLDSELLGIKVDFQWTALLKVLNLGSIRSKKVTPPRHSLTKDNLDFILPSKQPIMDTKIIRKNTGNSRRVRPVTNKDEKQRQPLSKLEARNNLNLLSKSLVSLNEQGRKSPSLDKYNYPSSSNGSKTTASMMGKTQPNSAVLGKGMYSPLSVVNVDIDKSAGRVKGFANRNFKDSRDISRSFDNISKSSKVNLTQSGLLSENIDAEYSKRMSSVLSPSRTDYSNSDVFDEPSPPPKIMVTIKKSSDEAYGIGIVDGMLTTWKKEGIFIYDITKNSPAHKCQKIKPGDEIISINNFSVQQLNFTECLMLMQKSITVLQLLIVQWELPGEFLIIEPNQ